MTTREMPTEKLRAICMALRKRMSSPSAAHRTMLAHRAQALANLNEDLSELTFKGQPGAQSILVGSQPDVFLVPAYTGPTAGWCAHGFGLRRDAVEGLIYESWEHDSAEVRREGARSSPASSPPGLSAPIRTSPLARLTAQHFAPEHLAVALKASSGVHRPRTMTPAPVRLRVARRQLRSPRTRGPPPRRFTSSIGCERSSSPRPVMNFGAGVSSTVPAARASAAVNSTGLPRRGRKVASERVVHRQVLRDALFLQWAVEDEAERAVLIVGAHEDHVRKNRAIRDAKARDEQLPGERSVTEKDQVSRLRCQRTPRGMAVRGRAPPPPQARATLRPKARALAKHGGVCSPRSGARTRTSELRGGLAAPIVTCRAPDARSRGPCCAGSVLSLKRSSVS